nr:RNA-directed DNA polymerase, eukaryota, reverse transcriptase zinc-binding domain protein [Tanacetum cinerariifolium]
MEKGKAKFSWKAICRLKNQGGLGLKSLREWNEVMVIKHLWNIASKKHTLWAHWIVRMKLNNKSIWEISTDSNASWIWKALHLKWRVKVTSIEESKDLTSLLLDELIGNLKVIIKKDSEMVKGKREQSKSLALKAKEEFSDEESLTSDSDDEEYATAMEKMVKAREIALDVEIQIISSENAQNHQEKNQRDFVGTWSDSDEDEEEKTKDETCLVA